MKHTLLILALVFAGFFSAQAQTTAFTYQGHLMDGGASANGTYDVQFTLWDSATNSFGQVGTTPPPSIVSAVNGIFTVTLDFGAAAFPGSDRWLQLAVRPNGSASPYTVLIPRQKVNSAPYAIRALNATNLTGTLSGANIVAGSITGTQLASGLTLSGSTSGTFVGNLTGNVSGSAATFTGALAGDVTGTQTATSIAPATVTGKALTGFSSTTGTITSSDTILSAINKLNGNVALKAPLASPSFTGAINLSGSLSLPATSSASVGVINQDGNRLIHTYGDGSFYAGTAAGNFTMTGNWNTACGMGVLQFNSTGASNAAIGSFALADNTTGTSNTAAGESALADNSTGSDNTALGYQALVFNTRARRNVAVGSGALFSQSFGNGTSGLDSYNVALGYHAMRYNEPVSTSTGVNNTAVGGFALFNNSTGANNIALGFGAGGVLTTGSNNIHIGHSGASVSESNTIRIGDTQTQTYLAGVIHGDGSGLTNLSASALNGTVGSTQIADSTIVNADISTSAAIADTKLATIATSGKVANSATTATSSNTALSIVQRDASGDFTAGTITTVENFALPATTGAGAGVLNQGGTRLLHTYGVGNLFAGYQAGNFTMTGSYNTGNGLFVLDSNTTGFANTGSGVSALDTNTTGNYNTASGYLALFANDTGSYNTAHGASSLGSNQTGTSNTAVGYMALSANTTGSYNTASGYQALAANSGSYNTASGSGALNSNTTGFRNTATGSDALASNTSGIENTADGRRALFANTTGSSNTATGTDALDDNTTGSYNTANGKGVLTANTVGENNTGIGLAALGGNTTGSRSVAMGPYSMYNQTFSNGGVVWNSHNVAVGYQSLYTNNPTAVTNGINNVALGSFALFSNTTGANNIAVGHNAGNALTNGSNNIAIGHVGVAGESGKIRIGTGGTHSDTYLAGQVHLSGAIFDVAATKSLEVRLDAGLVPGINIDGTGGNLGVLRLRNAMEIWPSDDATRSGRLDLRNTSNAVTLTLDGSDGEIITTGRAGIGRTAAANQLEVEGNASKTTAGSWLANSDRRIKEDIATVTNALETLNKVRLVDFRYTDSYRASHPGIDDKRYLNVVAQEFREVFPEHVKSSGEKLPDGSEILQVDTYPLTIYSAAGVQELHRETRALREENAALRKNSEALMRRLERLERALTYSSPDALKPTE